MSGMPYDARGPYDAEGRNLNFVNKNSLQKRPQKLLLKSPQKEAFTQSPIFNKCLVHLIIRE